MNCSDAKCEYYLLSGYWYQWTGAIEERKVLALRRRRQIARGEQEKKQRLALKELAEAAFQEVELRQFENGARGFLSSNCVTS